MKRGEGGHARVAPVARKHGRRGHAPLAEPIPGKHRMPPRTAEDERAPRNRGRERISKTIRGCTAFRCRKSAPVPDLPFGPKAFHAGAVFEGHLELAHIKAAVAPRDPLEVNVVLEPPIPKRHERPLRDPVADRGLGREDVVEERGHVDAVGSLGRGREAERERAFEAGQHAAVARGLRVVHLVDHAVIEGPGRGGGRIEGRDAGRTGEFLDRGDDEGAREIARVADEPARMRGRPAGLLRGGREG